MPSSAGADVVDGLEGDAVLVGESEGTRTVSPLRPYLVNLGSGQLSKEATTHILAMRDWLKMFGVYAPTVPTEMIEMKPRRNRAVRSIPKDDMCAAGPSIITHGSVSSTAYVALPNPASIGINDVVRAPAPSAVIPDIPRWLALDESEERAAFRCDRRRCATSTHAKTRWVRAFAHDTLRHVGTPYQSRSRAGLLTQRPLTLFYSPHHSIGG